jgi:hypothetical protein
MLVTYDTAVEHLKLTFRKTEPEIISSVTRLLAQAEGIVLTHIKTYPEEWTDATDPAEDHDFAIVQAAILNVLANLNQDRGDESRGGSQGPMPTLHGPLSPRVAELLSPLRDPSLA